MPSIRFNHPKLVSLRRHPVFPALVFILASMLTGEFYPFSPYSMFSNPRPRPLEYCYIADGAGQPLPIRWHTGVTPASITKKFNLHRSEGEETPSVGTSPEERAGLEVLNWLRDLSLQRKKRELVEPIRLVSVKIMAGPDGKLTENSDVVAELK